MKQAGWEVVLHGEECGRSRTLSQAHTIATGVDDRFKLRRMNDGTYFDVHTGIEIRRITEKGS